MIAIRLGGKDHHVFDSGTRDRSRPEPPVEGGQPAAAMHRKAEQVRVGDFSVAREPTGGDDAFVEERDDVGPEGVSTARGETA